jgi:hypothetical protein
MKLKMVLGACLVFSILGCSREPAPEPLNIEIAVDLDGNITINGEEVSTCAQYYEKIIALAPDFQATGDCPLSFPDE